MENHRYRRNESQEHDSSTLHRLANCSGHARFRCGRETTRQFLHPAALDLLCSVCLFRVHILSSEARAVAGDFCRAGGSV